MRESGDREARGIRRKVLLGLAASGGALLILGVLALLYLNLAGFPAFLQERVERAARSRGFSWEAETLRLAGWRRLSARQVQIQLLPDAAWSLRIPDAVLVWRPVSGEWDLTFSQARAEWAVHNPEDPSKIERMTFEAVNFAGRVGGEILKIHQLEARAGGLLLRGEISLEHPGELREWFATLPERPPDEDWQARLFTLASRFNQVQWAEPGGLDFQLSGDGRHVGTFEGAAQLDLPWAACDLGAFEQVRAQLRLPAEARGGGTRTGSVTVALAAAAGEWGSVQDLELEGEASYSIENLELHAVQQRFRAGAVENPQGRARVTEVDGRSERSGPAAWTTCLEGQIEAIQTDWGNARRFGFQAQVHHQGATLTDGWVEVELEADGLQTPQATASKASGRVRIEPRSFPPGQTGTSRAEDSTPFWEFLGRFAGAGECGLEELEVLGAQVDRLSGGFAWDWPLLSFEDVRGALHGGTIEGTAKVDVPRRELTARTVFDFDVHAIRPLFPTNTQRWLRQFSWERPPEVEGELRLTLPHWKLGSLEWRGEVLPRLELAGGFSGQGEYRGVPVESAHSRFTLTNRVWRLPALHLTRPEGEAELAITWGMEDRSFVLGLISSLDPRVVGRVLDQEEVWQVLDWFDFATPPSLEGSAWGIWGDWERIEFDVKVEGSSFLFRGERCDALSGQGRYRDGVLVFEEVSLRHDRQHLYAPAGLYAPQEGTVFLTNAVSTMDPDLVARVIGPRARAALAPFRFERPPLIRVNGTLPTLEPARANARFDLRGEQFIYRQFTAPQIAGIVDWKGEEVRIHEVRALFYGGDFRFEGWFDFSGQEPGAEFWLRQWLVNADLQELARDLAPDTSRLEGTLRSEMVISRGHSKRPETWGGRGSASVENGYLWEVPVFGLFSPILNTISPGLGNSLFSSASASFTLEGGVARTQDLELRSPALTLLYAGKVDYEGNVQARVHAEILRQAWGIGQILRLALRPLTKVLEYEITGTLAEPVSEPVYLPRFTLHPLRTLRAWFSRGGRRDQAGDGSEPRR